MDKDLRNKLEDTIFSPEEAEQDQFRGLPGDFPLRRDNKKYFSQNANNQRGNWARREILRRNSAYFLPLPQKKGK